MTNIMTILPLAIVMIAGPQIISSIILATSDKAYKNSLAFLAGVLVAIILGVSLFYFSAGFLHDSTTKSQDPNLRRSLDYIVVFLLTYLTFHVYRTRKKTEPPKWMSKLQSATPSLALKLGLLLFLVMPTDLVTMFSVGSWLAKNNAPLVQSLPFIILTMLLVGLPLILLVAMGKKAEVLLPKIRKWMSMNSWLINEIVIVFFLIMTISGMS